MQSRLLVLSLLGVTACATAGGGTGGDDTPADDDGTTKPDANPQQPPDAEPIGIDAAVPDAMPIDAAPPMPVTLTQNTATNVVSGNSAACLAGQFSNVTKENSYYRVFSLNDEGVTGQFTAKTVQFGIEHSTAQNVEVKLYTLNGTFTVGHLTPLSTQSVAVAASTSPQTQNVTLTSPVVVPAGSLVVAEVHVFDGVPTNAEFFIGSNTAGEQEASYIRAPFCNINEPSSTNWPTGSSVHIVLTVSGTTP